MFPPPVSCCFKCHFAWEEREAVPYLPPELQERILREHAAIERCGFTGSLVDDHAKRELVAFRKYCPPEVCDQIEADHIHLDKTGGQCGCGG